MALPSPHPAQPLERNLASPSRRGGDLVAGVTSGILAVPQGIAFALVAHVPPEHGLYAMIVPTIVAALVRESPFLVTGATNTSALVIGGLVTSLAVDPSEAVPLMLLITLLMGLMQVGAGAVGLGGIGRYVSQAVLVGFTFGAATLIFTDQIRNVLGLDAVSSPRFVETVQSLLPRLADADARAIAIAAATWAVLWGSARISPIAPGALIALSIAGFGTWALGWGEGPNAVRMVGEVPRALPGLTVPELSLTRAGDVLGASAAIALLGMVEAISIGKALSARAGIKFHANRELLAKGLGNVAGAFTGCMPTSASWTRSAIHLRLGARTRWVGVIAGLTVLAVMLILAPFGRFVPKAALGGIVMWIALLMIDVPSARYVWRWSRADAAVLVLTFGTTLLLPIQYAIYAGVIASLLLLVRRAGELQMVEMVEVGPRLFREIEIDEETGKSPLVLLQLEGDLFFGVVEELEDRLEAIARNGARAIIIRLRRAHAIDATAAEALADFAARFRERGGRLILCGLKPALLETIARSHLGEVVGEDNLLPVDARHFGSLRAAIESARRFLPAAGEGPEGPLIRRLPASEGPTYSI